MRTVNMLLYLYFSINMSDSLHALRNGIGFIWWLEIVSESWNNLLWHEKPENNSKFLYLYVKLQFQSTIKEFV